MPSKAYKTITAFFDENGYTWDRTNSKQVQYFTHPLCPEVGVTSGIEEHRVRHLIRNMQRDLGLATAKDQAKRHPDQIKERQAAERERLAAAIVRHEADIADLVHQREARLGGLGRVLSDREVLDIEHLIEEKERELRMWEALMTEIPTPSIHAGPAKARHRS
jgi:hypothetical protein